MSEISTQVEEKAQVATDVTVAGEPPSQETSQAAPQPDAIPEKRQPAALAEGESRFGIKATGGPIGARHWLADSAVCGDMVMALPSSVIIAGRSKEAGGVAVDMEMFLDAIIEGAAKLQGIPGVAEAASLPVWAVGRLFGTFAVLMDVYHESIDQAVLAVEAAAMKAAIGMQVTNTRKMTKTKRIPKTTLDARGNPVETVEETREENMETFDKHILPDPALSKLILTSRMKSRYKDEGGVKQAIQINISGAEAAL